MDADRFDHLSKAFSGTGRRLIGLLTTAPVLRALTVLFSPEEGEAEHPPTGCCGAKRRSGARPARSDASAATSSRISIRTATKEVGAAEMPQAVAALGPAWRARRKLSVR
jgi:hypothetical protein